MKKLLLYLFILLCGVGIGYLLNYNTESEQLQQEQPEELLVSKRNEKSVKRTVTAQKPVIESDSNLVDSNEEVDIIVDTLFNQEVEEDPEEIEIAETEEEIIMEEMIAQRSINLEPLTSDSIDVSGMLDLKSSSFSEEIVLEFWQSPLNITGYELSRNRLKLFGFNPNESISLQLGKNEDQILLNTESVSIVLHKTKQFKTLKLR